MNDLVSIVMPSYNTARYIKDSIDSVKGQTYQNWELIIVDDCSTDDTDLVVLPYLRDERIKYIKNEKNSGAAVSRNRAIREAQGRWIAFLDSDDLWEREKLEKQLGFMKSNGHHFSYTKYLEFDEGTGKATKTVSGPQKITLFGMSNYCYPGCLTVMYDAGYVGLVQIPDIKKNNDYAMWLKICRKADCWLCGEILATYRKRKGSISRHGVMTLIQWHYKLWREVAEKGKFASMLYTIRNVICGMYKKIRYCRRVNVNNRHL